MDTVRDLIAAMPVCFKTIPTLKIQDRLAASDLLTLTDSIWNDAALISTGLLALAGRDAGSSTVSNTDGSITLVLEPQPQAIFIATWTAMEAAAHQ